ncbi:unnamed protein product [Leptidea sinapis]|uniref:DUF4746 domain-containing protein n=1 Tax=Leptidea sinapis TaxID=189913 RepID=A0A5E4Q5X7_9NEOP|nr:unnamed protein product [Leptidea sinapis]
MVSISKDSALLELMDLNPSYVSKDSTIGELECSALFPVGYGDEYPEFEDFDSIKQTKKSCFQRKSQKLLSLSSAIDVLSGISIRLPTVCSQGIPSIECPLSD